MIFYKESKSEKECFGLWGRGGGGRERLVNFLTKILNLINLEKNKRKFLFFFCGGGGRGLGVILFDKLANYPNL